MTNFHLRMYTCDRCLRTTALWVPMPAPENIKLVRRRLREVHHSRQQVHAKGTAMNSMLVKRYE